MTAASRICSLDHLVRPRQHVRRNRQADLLGSLQVDDQLELRGLLHREIGGLGAFEDFINEGCRAPPVITAEPQPNRSDSRKGAKSAKKKMIPKFAVLASWRDQKN